MAAMAGAQRRGGGKLDNLNRIEARENKMKRDLMPIRLWQ